MTSDRQAAANRRNALRSTGPRTPDGKDTAKMNALRHGLRAETLVLPDEDPAEFERFRQSLFDELAPRGELEAVLVERIILLAWRLRRVGQIEARVFVYCDQLQVARAAREKVASIRNRLQDQLRARSVLAEDQQACREAFLEAEQADQQAEASRPLQSAALGGNDNFLANVSRYETTLERSLFKALHELERLQARRAGQPVPPPAVVDVNVDVNQDVPTLPDSECGE